MMKPDLTKSLLLTACLGVASLLLTACLDIAIAPDAAIADSEWSNQAGDAFSQRFVAERQINRSNINQLEVAWTFRTGELDFLADTRLDPVSTFECTPLVIDGRMYLITGTNRVFALDARSGRKIWSYDPRIDLNLHYPETAARGVSFWSAKERREDGSRDERIFFGTLDGRLIGLDAATGLPLPAFGNGGSVDLRPGALPLQSIPEDQTAAWSANAYYGADVEVREPRDFPNRAAYNQWALGKSPLPQVTSPPAIVGNVIVVGSAIRDNSRTMNARGIVRGYDVHKGELLWLWDPVPRHENASGDTWSDPRRVGGGNAWAPITGEPAHHRVFVPTSSPSPDYFGGERVGSNQHANSLVALDTRTGKLLWSFQIVHHDLWDYDLPQRPVLLTVERSGNALPAVAVATKPGHIFVLHRDTGEPIFRVEERPVPTSNVPGEVAHPTQPFPAEFPLFGLRQVGVDDAFGRTPEELQAARDRIVSLDSKGIFTPPTTRGAIHAPSNIGGMNWGGMAWHPEKHLLVTPTNRIASVVRLVSNSKIPKELRDGERLARESVPMLGSPYMLVRDYLFSLGSPDSSFTKRYGSREIIPQTQPPWGTLAAVDTQTGKLAWEIPLGRMTEADPATFPDHEHWGSLVMGGPIVTASGLVFIAGTVDPFLRAFDIESGKKLWEQELPAAAQSTPMSFAVDGRQYIAVAAGGHSKLGTKRGDFLQVFALPR